MGQVRQTVHVPLGCDYGGGVIPRGVTRGLSACPVSQRAVREVPGLLAAWSSAAAGS